MRDSRTTVGQALARASSIDILAALALSLVAFSIVLFLVSEPGLVAAITEPEKTVTEPKTEPKKSDAVS